MSTVNTPILTKFLSSQRIRRTYLQTFASPIINPLGVFRLLFYHTLIRFHTKVGVRVIHVLVRTCDRVTMISYNINTLASIVKSVRSDTVAF